MTSITSPAGKDRAALALRATRVNSSTTVRILSGLPSSVRLVGEVVAPDVVAALQAIRRVERPFSSQRRDFLDLSDRDLKALRAPDAQYPFAVQFPARAFKQGSDALVAIAGVLEGKHPDLGGEVVLFRIGFWDVALGAAGLAQHPAGSSFRHRELGPDVVDALAPPLRA